MEEIRPGLWIGNIRAISQLKKNGNDSYCTRWTVITVLKDVTLLQFVRNTIAEYRTHTQSDTSKRFEVIEHIEWILPDTVQAKFVSPQLLHILETMNKTFNSINDNDPTTSQCLNESFKNMKVMNACLVHCAQGISRSAAVIAAFLLVRKECVTIQAALHTIRLVRSCVQPNVEFLAGLRAIEQCDGNIVAAIDCMKRHECNNETENGFPLEMTKMN